MANEKSLMTEAEEQELRQGVLDALEFGDDEVLARAAASEKTARKTAKANLQAGRASLEQGIERERIEREAVERYKVERKAAKAAKKAGK